MELYGVEHKRQLINKILFESLECLRSAVTRLESIKKDFNKGVMVSEFIISGFNNAIDDVLKCRYKVGTSDTLEEIFMPVVANLNDACLYWRGCFEPWANGMPTPPLTPRILRLILTDVAQAIEGIQQVYSLISDKTEEVKTLGEDEIFVV